jgi:hypothetical protein
MILAKLASVFVSTKAGQVQGLPHSLPHRDGGQHKSENVLPLGRYHVNPVAVAALAVTSHRISLFESPSRRQIG